MSKPWKTTATLERRVKDPELGHIRRERVETALEFDIDWAGLARQLGQKALDNRSGRSRFLNGLIVVRVAKPKAAKARP